MEALRQKQAGAREGPESGARVGWKVQGTFLGPYLCRENRQPMADRDPPIRAGSRPQGKTHSRPQVRVKEGEDRDKEGPCTDRCQVIGDPQLEGPGMEETLEKNIHQREGSRTSSLGESRIHKPPGPPGSPPFSVLDPSPPKGGGAETREGCCQGGVRNKIGTQARGGPELSRLSPPPREPSTGRRGTGDHWGKLDRDRSRMLQLKADLQHREEALKQQLAGARERQDNGAGRGMKIQDGVHSRQRERSGEWGDLK